MRNTVLRAAMLGAFHMAAQAGITPAPLDPVRLETASKPAPSEHTLDAGDLDAWLDGYVPYALATSDIAGAVVVVVKEGRVLTQRGFGYADIDAQKPVDPNLTMFRPGSVSKLFTWTAVMQLVEAGKLNLDADINAYLDMKIPPRDGKPITLRNLLTHTSGFEETAKHLFATDAQHLPKLGVLLKAWIPERMYPPGEIPAYSNYGAALAGYIVERVSGEPFDAYINRHIFQPLGMQHSTFTQPLPANLIPDMSKGYARASRPPRPFELIGPSPAGSLASTGSDMARFMIAQLQNGTYGTVQILKPETAQLMHWEANIPTPPFPGMTLGFYREDRNGHVVIGHGGDTEVFHSDLHLFLNDGVGLFLSMNSLGPGAAAGGVRTLLFREFADRYFPAPVVKPLPTLASAKHDAAVFAGNYWASRRSASNFLLIAALVSEVTVRARADGTLEIPDVKTPGHAVKHWREVGPFLWQEIGGRTLLKAIVTNGRVQHFTTDEIPAIEIFQPVPLAFNAKWNMPLFYGSCMVFLIAVLLWPIAALVRRYYGRQFVLTGRAAGLYRIVRFTALIDLLSVAGWLTIVSLLKSNIGVFNDPINPWLRLLQAFGFLGVVGAVAAVWNVVVLWRQNGPHRLWVNVSAILLALACLDFAWLVLLLRLMGPSVNF
jgi:CubicO group peptidase (beta-lactamase class C family)